ncbi:MAG: Gldg family protein [Clostridia bacterium]|nr:Gldg family protein [Clostridia bacterium]
MKNQKKFRYSLNSKAFIVGAVIIVLLLNAILISLNDKIALEIDFTEDKIYALADESKEIAGQIDEPTEILILTSGVDNEILSMVKNVLGNFGQHNSKITIREVNVVKEPAAVQAYAKELETLSQFSLIIRQSDRYEIVNSQDYFSQNGFSYIERLVTTKLATFVDGIHNATILFTKGHGEQVSEGNVGILEMTGYEVGQIDTLTEDFPAAEDSVVIISCPQVDFSVEEIDKLDAYLDLGGNVQIYFDPVYCSTELPNLVNYLSEDWGLIRNTDIVWDMSQMIENSNYMLAQMSDHEITAPVYDSQKRVGYGPANSIGRAPEKPANVTIHTLLKSYDSAYAKADIQTAISQGSMEKASGDAEGPFDVLVAASRENENVAGELHVGHLVVSGSALIFDALTADTRFANEDILLNSISWMQGGESSITVRAKMLPGGSMSVSKTQFWTWLVILVVVVPLAILVAGILVFVKRRYK